MTTTMTPRILVELTNGDSAWFDAAQSESKLLEAIDDFAGNQAWFIIDHEDLPGVNDLDVVTKWASLVNKYGQSALIYFDHVSDDPDDFEYLYHGCTAEGVHIFS